MEPIDWGIDPALRGLDGMPVSAIMNFRRHIYGLTDKDWQVAVTSAADMMPIPPASRSDLPDSFLAHDNSFGANTTSTALGNFDPRDSGFPTQGHFGFVTPNHGQISAVSSYHQMQHFPAHTQTSGTTTTWAETSIQALGADVLDQPQSAEREVNTGTALHAGPGAPNNPPEERSSKEGHNSPPLGQTDNTGNTMPTSNAHQAQARQSHNRVGKRYRDKLNNQFELLQSDLHLDEDEDKDDEEEEEEEGDEGTANKGQRRNINKAKVLAMTRERLLELLREREELKAQTEELMQGEG